MDILNHLNKLVIDNEEKINEWIFKKSDISNPPFYTSTDLRISQNKIAAVDTNIFPAGFNNLSPIFKKLGSEHIDNFINKNFNFKISKVLIIPEIHTRNPFYWDNVLAIQDMLSLLNVESKVGLVLEDEVDFEFDFDSTSNVKVTASLVKRNKDTIYIDNFEPDLIIINNDFSNFYPEILSKTSQIIVPSIEVGWHTRKKDIHFHFYNSLVEEFSKIIKVDKSFFSLDTELVSNIDIDNIKDRERVSKVVDRISNKSNSGAFIKSNVGTYGMSVMNIKNGEDFINLNRDGRKKMKISKGGRVLNDLIVQESVPTVFKNKEPVYYLIDNKVCGGFFRVNDSKGDTDNLNTRGMYFSCICMEKNCLNCDKFLQPILTIISKIGSLATGLEIQHIIEDV